MFDDVVGQISCMGYSSMHLTPNANPAVLSTLPPCYFLAYNFNRYKEVKWDLKLKVEQVL